MNFNAIIKRVIAIITKPNEEWKVIKGEKMTVTDMFLKYAVVLAAIPAIAGFIGFLVIGRSFAGFTFRAPFGNALVWAILMYAVSLGAVYLLGFVIDALAPSFGSPKEMIGSLKVAVFSNTAFWVAGIFYIIPALGIFAMIGGLYSLFLLFTGIKIVKNPPQDKAAGYFIVVIIAEIIIGVLIWFLVSRIAFGSAAAVF